MVRPASPGASSSSQPKVVKSSNNNGKVVSVCNKSYTSLGWFLGQANPSPSLCAKARRECYKNALELENGDFRTLVVHGYAADPPKAPKPLLPDRERLPGQWCDTPITTERGCSVKVRKVGDCLQKANRQVLWLVADLSSVFAEHKK